MRANHFETHCHDTSEYQRSDHLHIKIDVYSFPGILFDYVKVFPSILWCSSTGGVILIPGQISLITFEDAYLRVREIKVALLILL